MMVEAVLVTFYTHVSVIGQLVLVQELFGWRRVCVFRYDEALFGAVTGSGGRSVCTPAPVLAEKKGNYTSWSGWVQAVMIDNGQTKIKCLRFNLFYSRNRRK